MPLTAGPPVTGWRRPLSLRGTGLPPNLALMARALGLCVALREWWHPPGVALPMVGHAEATGAVTTWTVRLLALGLALLLVANRWVAPAAVGLGTLLLLQVVASRVYYANNRTYTALVLVLVGLSVASRLPWVRYQIVLLYAAAALNKLLDADWRSGAYLDAFSDTASGLDRLLDATPGLERLGAAQVMSWSVIVFELALAAAFCVPRLFGLAAFSGIAYHTSLVLSAHRTFGLFWYVTAISYLAFLCWPATQLDVYADPSLRRHRLLRRVLSRLDVDGALLWHDDAGRWRCGPGGRESSGTAAVVRAAARVPAVLLAALGVVALPHTDYDVAWAAVVMLGLVAYGVRRVLHMLTG